MAWTDQAEELKSNALSISALVVTVNNESAQALAVQAQIEVRSVVNRAEAARVLYKAPYLARNKQIDASHGDWVRPLLSEDLRLAEALGNYQERERAKKAHAQACHNQNLLECEREREAACAAAATDEARDLIMEEYSRNVRDLGPRPEVEQAKGQRVSEDWDWDVTDIHLLARAFPSAVEIKVRRSVVKELLDAGVKVVGINARKVTKSSVILAKTRVIEVDT